MRIRIPWQRNPAGGFIAYPEGEAAKTRYATIERNSVGHGDRAWRWQVVYDECRRFLGWEGSQQACADAAVAAWPHAKAEAAELAAKAADDALLRTNVQRMIQKGDLPLSLFSIETAPSERLTHIIWLIRDGGGVEGPAKPLVDAISAELYRRRMAQPTGTTTEGSGGPVRT